MKNVINKKAVKQLNKCLAEGKLQAVIVDVMPNGKHNTVIVEVKGFGRVAVSGIPCTPQDKTFKFTGNKLRQAVNTAVKQEEATTRI